MFFHLARLFPPLANSAAHTVKSAHLHSARSDKDGKWPAFACLFHFFNSGRSFSTVTPPPPRPSPSSPAAAIRARPHTRKKKKYTRKAPPESSRKNRRSGIALYVSSTAAFGSSCLADHARWNIHSAPRCAPICSTFDWN